MGVVWRGGSAEEAEVHVSAEEAEVHVLRIPAPRSSAADDCVVQVAS
jgi:hypothetical protein